MSKLFVKEKLMRETGRKGESRKGQIHINMVVQKASGNAAGGQECNLCLAPSCPGKEAEPP